MATLSKEQIEWLAEKKLLGTITPGEQLLLNEWLQTRQGDEVIWEGNDEDETALHERLLGRIRQDAGIGKYAERRPKVSIMKQHWWWAAAAIIVLFGGSYLAFFKERKLPPGIVKTNSLFHDVLPPAYNRATVTLADGHTVYLDSAGNGQLVTQGNIKLVKLADGQIAYQTASAEIIPELQYNTLINPRGSKVIDMILADGSHVWLNAGSSVTYPVSFIGDERKVSITGEAYFEIAHDKTKPFKVSKGDMTVEVLGTHFNVNAYEDESDIKVTLLEGSVKVGNNNGAVTIRPGQQASLTNNQQPVTSNPDLDEMMAWKNGRFSFNRADIQTVMRQLARWYDLEVEYRGEVTKDLFGGDIKRDLSLSEVLDFLKKSQVQFEVEGKKVIVMP